VLIDYMKIILKVNHLHARRLFLLTAGLTDNGVSVRRVIAACQRLGIQ
jgi:hypothetical protein